MTCRVGNSPNSSTSNLIFLYSVMLQPDLATANNRDKPNQPTFADLLRSGCVVLRSGPWPQNLLCAPWPNTWRFLSWKSQRYQRGTLPVNATPRTKWDSILPPKRNANDSTSTTTKCPS